MSDDEKKTDHPPRPEEESAEPKLAEDASVAKEAETTNEEETTVSVEEPDNLVNGFFETVRDVLFTPEKFFRTLPLEGGIGVPLFFAGTCTFLSFLGDISNRFITSKGEGGFNPFAALFETFGNMVAFYILFFLMVGIYKLAFRLFGFRQLSYSSLLRFFSYTCAPSVLGVIPLIGSITAFCWGMVVSVVGFREVLRISTGKAIAAVIAPLVIVLGVVLLVGFLVLLLYLAAMGVSLHDFLSYAARR